MHIPRNAEVKDYATLKTDISGSEIVNAELLSALGLAYLSISLGGGAEIIVTVKGFGLPRAFITR